MRKGQEYIDELAGVVAIPTKMERSLINFARAIKVLIEKENQKIDPDNCLISVLADAARLGWEQIEWANADVNKSEE